MLITYRDGDERTAAVMHGATEAFGLVAVIGAAIVLNAVSSLGARRLRGRPARAPMVRGQEVTAPRALRVGLFLVGVGLVGLFAVWII
jgi:hypothetical protein